MEFTAELIRDEVVKACFEKKAKDLVVVNVDHLTVIADYFVVCSGKSTTQVKGIANNVDDVLAKQGLEPLRREGIAEGRWAVLDYGSVIVHIFNDDTRLVYCLEQLWNDGSNVTRYEDDAE